jgi:hypothetical protein
MGLPDRICFGLSILIARSVSDEAIQNGMWGSGSLRFARNDGNYVRGMTSCASIPVVRQHRQRRDLDAFLDQLARLLRRGFAKDRPMLDVAVMHLARFARELLADIVGVLHDMVAQLFQLGAQQAPVRPAQARGGGPSC